MTFEKRANLKQKGVLSTNRAATTGDTDTWTHGHTHTQTDLSKKLTQNGPETYI